LTYSNTIDGVFDCR
jgi:hypothetical protein